MSEYAIGGFRPEIHPRGGIPSPRRSRPRAAARPEPPRISRREYRPQAEARPEAARRAPSRAESRGALERGLGILLAMAGAALLSAAAFILLPPALRVTRYEISGATAMSQREVLDAALIHGTEYLFSLDPARVRSALLASPRVAEARVRRIFPNGLRIELAERVPVAAVLAERNGRLESVLLDAEGVAFAFALEYEAGAAAASAAASATPAGAAPSTSKPVRTSELPIVSGLRFEGFFAGARLPANLVPLLASLGELEASAPALLAAFSEIRIVKPRFGDPELVLYPLHHRVPVRTGAVLNEATLRSIILVLDVLGSRGLADGLEEIDFRRGTVVYRTKEGQSD
ncbi:MAG: FtsQ-type POTRA domain-containing protein [Spirochaetaceae bacterium]|nr:FtsQ-type POTRA domain-containing protein [Spirochaetaceae bacterium]